MNYWRAAAARCKEFISLTFQEKFIIHPFPSSISRNIYMKTINYRELKRRVDLDGLQKTTSHLTEAIESRQLLPEDFSLRDLAEALVPDGLEWVRTFDPCNGTALTESDGVDSTAFLNITGRIVGSKIRESGSVQSLQTRERSSVAPFP